MTNIQHEAPKRQGGFSFSPYTTLLHLQHLIPTHTPLRITHKPSESNSSQRHTQTPSSLQHLSHLLSLLSAQYYSPLSSPYSLITLLLFSHTIFFPPGHSPSPDPLHFLFSVFPLPSPIPQSSFGTHFQLFPNTLSLYFRSSSLSPHSPRS